MMQTEITAIEIRSGDRVMKLSVDEAKALYRQLDELFGERVITYPSHPVYVERWPWSPTPPFDPTYPIITCEGRAHYPECGTT